MEIGVSWFVAIHLLKTNSSGRCNDPRHTELAQALEETDFFFISLFRQIVNSAQFSVGLSRLARFDRTSGHFRL